MKGRIFLKVCFWKFLCINVFLRIDKNTKHMYVVVENLRMLSILYCKKLIKMMLNIRLHNQILAQFLHTSFKKTHYILYCYWKLQLFFATFVKDASLWSNSFFVVIYRKYFFLTTLIEDNIWLKKFCLSKKPWVQMQR